MKRSTAVYVVVILVLLAVTVLYTNKIKESYKNTKKKEKAFCIISKSPQTIWIEFILTFTKYYDVYMFVDDNSIDLTDIKKEYPSIQFIKYDEKICKERGFSNSSTATIKKEVIAWDKALYHFCRKEIQYEDVWFCEDDVFIQDVKNIIAIDKKYEEADLICTKLKIYRNGEQIRIQTHNDNDQTEMWPWWGQFPEYFDFPWAGSLIVIVRISRALLQEIDKFVEEHDKLIFIEGLFPTLAIQNNMPIAQPEMLKLLSSDKRHRDESLYSDYLIHPVKDIYQHAALRT